MVRDAEDVISPGVPIGGRGIQPGRKIGKYQILRHLATGGMAEVYLARATSIEHFQRLCVIKRILPTAAGDPAIVRMLIDEARIAATLHHSNVVQVFDMGQADGEYFICMEYLHGRDVQAIYRKTQKRGVRLAEDHALSIILGVCAGLHYAHEKKDEQGRPLGIVHRDVSPTNVIITHDGGVKLVDFGLVKAEGRMTESRSGSIKGKLAYMSPEQCRARAVDRRSDVFSLCTMLWELTTGGRLFTGECDYDYMTAILEKEPKRPSDLIPDYPPVLEAIVMKGLAKDPADRYQTCEELQLEIEDYCRERKVRVSPITLRKMMEELFGDELDEDSEEQVMRSLADGSAHGSLPPMSAENTSPDVQVTRVSRPIEAVSAPDEKSLASTSPLPSIPQLKRSRAPLWIALALAVAGAAVGGYVMMQRPQTPASVPAASETPAPTPTPPPSPPAAAAAPTVPEPTVPTVPEPTVPTVPESTVAAPATTAKVKRPPAKPSKPATKAGKPAQPKDLDSMFPE